MTQSEVRSINGREISDNYSRNQLLSKIDKNKLNDNGTGADELWSASKVNAQFNTKEKLIDINLPLMNTVGYNEDSSTLRGMVTFVDDDGRNGTYEKLKQVCQAVGIPVTFALYKNSTITDAQALELQNTYGCEIAGHSMSHDYLHTLNEEQLEYELGDCKRMLLKRGFNVQNFVYPQNSHNELVHKVARKYYNCATTIGSNGLNYQGKLTNFGLSRAALGVSAEAGKDNLAYYKSLVDRAKTEKCWLIFMTHVSYETHTEAMFQDFINTAKYCKEVGIEVVNLQKGWEFFGNKLEIVSTQGKTKITNQGEIVTTVMDRAGINAPNFDADITEYKLGQVTITNFLASANTGFPGDPAGVLLTYRNQALSSHNLSYQEWCPFPSNKVYRRQYEDGWQAWSEVALMNDVEFKINQANIVKNVNSTSYLADTPIADYPNNQITVTVVPTARATGFPRNVAGLLTTYRFGGNGYDYQHYKEYADSKFWMRSTTTSGTWGVWKELTNA